MKVSTPLRWPTIAARLRSSSAEAKAGWVLIASLPPPADDLLRRLVLPLPEQTDPVRVRRRLLHPSSLPSSLPSLALSLIIS
eukprot:479566-Hanusia_phi.AAC.1